MKTFIVTGATRGLGLAIAKTLARNPEHRVVIAVRDSVQGAKVAATIGAEMVELDLDSRAAVHGFVAAWEGPIAGLVNNAGLQNTGPSKTTRDGWEQTIGVNHLAALELTLGLLPHLTGGRVLFIGSGTHDAKKRTATIFGFRGARYTSIAELARGDSDATNDKQRGLDRYATSKLLNTVTARELARRIPETRFFTLDPGLMAGTGLARTAPAAIRWAWYNVLPLLSRLMPGTSTPERSAAIAEWMLTDAAIGPSGETFGIDRKPSHYSADLTRDPILAKRVVDESLAFLGLGQLPQPTRLVSNTIASM